MRRNDDIEKVSLAAQSRVAYRDIADMPLNEAKQYAATATQRHVDQRLAGIEEGLAEADVDPEQIVQELEDE